MLASRLETVLIGHIRDGDDLTVFGRRIRIRTGLDDEFAFLLLAAWCSVGVQHRHHNLLQESFGLVLDAVAGFVATTESDLR